MIFCIAKSFYKQWIQRSILLTSSNLYLINVAIVFVAYYDDIMTKRSTWMKGWIDTQLNQPTAHNLQWYISTQTSLASRANGPRNFWSTLYVSVHKSDHQKYVNHWMKSWQKNWKPPCHHSRFLEFFAVCVQSFWGPWSHVRRPSRLSTLRWLLRHLLPSSSLYWQHVHWTRTVYMYKYTCCR